MQRTFVANASHELRTPITTIIGEAEVGLKRTRDEEEYRAILKSIIADADKLKDTITGLMELAQVDMDFTRAKLTPIRIDDLLWELQDYWGTKLKAPLLKVSISKLPKDERFLIINANKSLLVIAFNNIIGNAFKFSENNPVECELFADEITMQIKFIDQGIGVDENDRKKVLEPFYRSKNAEKYPGSGIGLYVTRKIIELFKGTVSILSASGKGLIVSISFVQDKKR
ncbi:Alkaline phosphatase synthesis sensor protein PhoR [compost metagenome]